MWKQVAYTNFGDEASMVMQWTVNPPLYSTTGSIPVISTKNIGESLGRRILKRPRPKGCPVSYFRLGLKVFTDAYMPVTHEERDRYPLGPPS